MLRVSVQGILRIVVARVYMCDDEGCRQSRVDDVYDV